MRQKREAKAIFFDVDDTMYDHLVPFRKAIWSYTSHLEHFPYEAAYHRMRYYSDILSLELGGAGKMEQSSATDEMRRRRFQLALQEFGILITEQEAEEVQQAYLSCQFDIECFTGMNELLLELQQRGILVGLLTNGAEAHQWRKICALGLDKLIDRTNIYISGTYGIDKPDPRIYQLINEKTETTNRQCTYVGDSWRNDVIGAHSAGWQMIWFNHRGQEPEHDNACYSEVKSVSELHSFLLHANGWN